MLQSPIPAATRKISSTRAFVMIVTSAALALVGSLLGGLSITPIIPYVSTLYIGVAFQVIFGDWFGLWGVIGVYIGVCIAEPLVGFPILFSFILGVTDVIQTGMFALGYRSLKYNAELKSRRDWLIHVIYNTLFVNILGATYTTLIFIYIFKYIGPVYYIPFWAGYYGGNIVITIIIGTLLLKLLSGYVKKTPLYVQGWLS